MASTSRLLANLMLLTPFLMAVALAQGGCGPSAGGALCQTGFCCSKFGYCGNTDAYCSTPNCQSQCPNSPPSPPSSPPPSPPPSPPSPPTPGPPGGGVGDIVTSAIFDQLFPKRNSFYTYAGFIAAANSFPTFGTCSDAKANTRDIAAFLAQISHETSGLVYVREIDQSGNYCDSSNTQYPCAANQLYFGRGPMQLSWNYNYGAAGAALNVDILSNADLVATDPAVSFKTALWFWTTAQTPKPAAHDVMVGNWTPSAADTAAGRLPGFGVTIDIVNGGIECGSGATNAAAATDRVNLYQNICATLNVDPGSNVGCANMQPF